MRKFCSVLAAAMVAGVLAGCAGPETKLGRGITNVTEVTRMGEMMRSVEQSSLFEGPNTGFNIGVVRGFDKTLARTGLGIFEIATFPIPPYHPLWTSYLTPSPGYPDSYKPGLRDAQSLNTDDRVWFSGGTVAPWIPGNRFRVFDN